MGRRMTRQILLIIAALTTLGAACSPQSASKELGGDGLGELFDLDRLEIVNDDGEHHVFDVYIAAKVAQQRRGLMFVRNLPETSGMLFVYEDAGMHSMWMKNTYVSLDIIFARADGSVSSVIHDAKPLSLASQGSIEPVSFVLELNAGVARRLNIGNRSRLIWERN